MSKSRQDFVVTLFYAMSIGHSLDHLSETEIRNAN